MTTDTAIQQPPPDCLKDAEAMIRWAQTPEGLEFFRLANMKLMEERVNAEREGRTSAAPAVVAINPFDLPTTTTTREENSQ